MFLRRTERFLEEAGLLVVNDGLQFDGGGCDSGRGSVGGGDDSSLGGVLGAAHTAGGVLHREC